jgi:hypothetical protein
MNRAHQKSGSALKLVHLPVVESGSSKIWFIKIGSLETVFRAMSIYPKFKSSIGVT